MALLSLGLLVLVGFLCAKLLQRLQLPAVTGYLLVGVLLGPSMLKVVGPDTLGTLKPLATFGLAIIFFLLGEEFRLKELKSMGSRFLSITVVQSLLTFATVAGLLALCHVPLPIALLMGAIAGTTDPAATIVVIRELRARGELVKTLMAVVALNTLVEMILFNALMPLVELLQSGGQSVSWQSALHGLFWEIGGSAMLGLGLAFVLRGWTMLPFGRSNLKLPTIGLILLGAGASEALHLSPLLVMLLFGAGVANAVPVKVAVFDLAKAMEGPLLVMFFTLSGASLHVAGLAAVGSVGLAYIGGRIVGKVVGGSLGASVAGAAPACRRYLGACLVSQASVALGLAYLVQERFPDIAGPIMPVTLGAVVVFEVIGPLLTRYALIRSGEVAIAAPAGVRTPILPVPKLAP